MSRRVAITSMGVVCSLGENLEAALGALRRNESSIGLLEAGEGDPIPAGVIDDEWISEKGAHFDRTTRLALTAAREALGPERDRGEPDRRLGCLLGTGLGGVETSEGAYESVYGRGSHRLRPMTIPVAMYSAPTSAVSARYGAGGPAMMITTACSSSAHAIGQAASWIREGSADRVIAGGTDAPLFPGIVAGWRSMRILAPAGEDPSRACRPFAADRKGLVLAEGAAILMLEEMESARRRGSPILGEVAGFGMSSDAGHLTDPTVEGPLEAMEGALAWGISRDSIEYVNAHGTATPANDRTEALSLGKFFGERISRIPVSSTKSVHGHAMGASGAVELVLSLGAALQGWIPGTPTTSAFDPELDFLELPSTSRDEDVSMLMSSSFGFGGMNAVLIVSVVAG